MPSSRCKALQASKHAPDLVKLHQRSLAVAISSGTVICMLVVVHAAAGARDDSLRYRICMIMAFFCIMHLNVLLCC